MSFRTLKYLILSDLYRKTGKTSSLTLVRAVIFGEAYKYNFWMRLSAYLKKKSILFPLYIISKLMLRHYRYKFGISIPETTSIGEGFFIGHFSGIFINGKCVIGKNCNISQGVTLGQANRGKNEGYPVIGDNVYIGPGVKIIGKVKLGNNVAIGANAVVTKSFPDNAVIAGVPAKIISMEGSQGYVEKVDYELFLNQ